MFASFEYFKSKLVEKTGCDPLRLRKLQKRAAKTAAVNFASPEPKRNESDSSIGSGSNGVNGNRTAQIGYGGQSGEDGSASPTIEMKLNNANNELSITSGTSIISEVSNVVKLNGENASFASAASGTESMKGILKTTGPHSGYQCLQINNKVHHIILDCSVWAFVDDTAVKLLTEVSLHFKQSILFI